MLNLSLPNLVWWCIIMSQIVFQKDWFGVFKVKVTVMDNIIEIFLFNILSELLILLQVNLVCWHIIIRWIVLWKDWIPLLWPRSNSQKWFRIPVNVHLDDISSADWTLCNQTWYGEATCEGQSVMQEDWFAIFMFRAHLIKYCCFYQMCWTTDLFAAKYNWMVHC